MRFHGLPLSLLVAILFLTGCLDGPYDPRGLPYRFEAREYPYRMVPVDLEGDGQDEYLEYQPAGAGPNAKPPSYVLRRHDGKTVDELPLFGRDAGFPLFLDVLPDPGPEILIPYVRNDSLFLGVFDNRGKKHPPLFLTTGSPRIDPEDGHAYPWDPKISALRKADVNGDGKEELIVVYYTGYARLPRGVAVFAWPERRLLDEAIVGAVTGFVALDDLDRDGRLELITQGYASNNGAVAGGFSDDKSYAIVFELGDDVRVDTSWVVPEAQSKILYDDFDNDGRKTLWHAVLAGFKTDERRTVIREFLPGTWRSVVRKTLNESFFSMQTADIDRDGIAELLFFKLPNELHVVDPDGWRVTVHAFEGAFRNPYPLPDLDGDGWEEVGLVEQSSRKLLVLGADLAPMAVAVLPLPGMSFTGFRAGVGRPTYLLAVSDSNANENLSVAYELVPNPTWWMYRYGVPALWVLGLGVVLGVGLVFRRLSDRNRLLDRLCAAHETDVPDGRLLLDPKGRVVRSNEAARACLDDPPEGLTAFLEALRAGPPLHRSQRLPTGDGSKTLVVSADPIVVRDGDRPYWLVTLHRETPYTAEDYRAWGLMAQRIAHDLKNPLTSILLTLQRLQLEYQRHHPEEAAVYDDYVQRIVERIEHLRQMTRTFMKFVDLDEPERREVSLNAFLREQVGHLADRLPADVSLAFRPEEGLSSVRIDTDQVSSVLDNLVTNALNAMPGGGLITLRTFSAYGLQLAGREGPDDYVVLEVMDTGTGITPATLEKIFEVGFSTNGSTGLGLALVKKIIEEHGGTIEVESDPGAGTVFTLYFPV